MVAITEYCAYVDTNIVLDIISNRKPVTTEIFDIVQDKKMKLCASHFTVMEAFDIRLEQAFVSQEIKRGDSLENILKRRNDRNLTPPDLTDVYNLVLIHFSQPYKKNIDFWNLNEDGWEYAIELMTKANFTARDAIHVATAIKSKSQNFLTYDSDLRKNSKKFINTPDPQNFLSNLKKQFK